MNTEVQPRVNEIYTNLGKLQLHVKSCLYFNLVPASVAQLDAPSDWRPGGRGFNPRRGRQHSYVEILIMKYFLRSLCSFR